MLLDVYEMELGVLIILCTATSLEISERLYLGAGEMAGVTRFLHFIQRIHFMLFVVVGLRC